MKARTRGGDASVGGNARVGLLNTGQFEVHVHLALPEVVAGMERLAQRVVAGDEAGFIADSSDAAGAALYDALSLLPRVVDQPWDLRARAYAVWFLCREADGPPELVAARRRYVALRGQVARDPLAPSFQLELPRTGPEAMPTRPIDDVAEALDAHPAVVLLGGSGAGKSTVLQRMAMDAAEAFLRDKANGGRLPLLLTLADDQQERIASPYDFVRSGWERQLPGGFDEMVRSGRVLLLLDGYNEMARLTNDGERNQRAQAWRRFFETMFSNRACASRAVVASRDGADYAAPLGLPRVTIDPLGADQTRSYLSLAGLDDEGIARFLAEAERLKLGDMLARPLDLAILAANFDPALGTLPPNRGQLFRTHARNLMAAEEAKGHEHWLRWPRLEPALAELCFALQAHGESTALARDRLVSLVPSSVEPYDGAAVEEVDAAAVVQLMEGARLVVPDERSASRDARRFYHQLFQEMYAGLAMLSRWEAGDTHDPSPLWRGARTPGEMPSPSDGPWDPLPEPPDNGWQQTTILAAGMADDCATFVRSVAAVNPALAGRCLVEGGLALAADDDGGASQVVKAALLRDLTDPALHRRARIQAGRLLGEVGDPRFEPVRCDDGVRVVVPPLVAVPGGRARIGRHRLLSVDRGRHPDEHPPCTVDVLPFLLGRFPVTNAEYRCFVAAGGYDDETLWSPRGWAWREGREDSNEALEDFLGYLRWRAANPARIEADLRARRITPDAAESERELIAMTEDERRNEIALWTAFRTGRRDGPIFDDLASANGSNQPRIGVGWFEADAYCRWLSRVLPALPWEGLTPSGDHHSALAAALEDGAVVRLATEAEWEWAAGGSGHRRYPWGFAWNTDRSNALDGRVLRATAVGAYPRGRAACGADDMSGNVWEWTRSVYRDYPYDAGDGRESIDLEGPRVVRGGSWSNVPRGARAADRFRFNPVHRNLYIGFRVVVAAPVS